MSLRIDWHRLGEKHGVAIAAFLNQQIAASKDSLPSQISRSVPPYALDLPSSCTRCPMCCLQWE